MKTGKDWVTVNMLVQITGAGPQHIQKWMALESVPSTKKGSRTLFETDAAVRVIREHQRGEKSTAVDREREEDTFIIQQLEKYGHAKTMLRVLNEETQKMLDALFDDRCEIGLSDKQVEEVTARINAVWSKAWLALPQSERKSVK